MKLNLQSRKDVSQKGYFETTHKQRHEWKFAQSRKGEEFLFKIKTIRKIKQLNIDLFQEAYETIICRHESLRTNFLFINNKLVQKINDWNKEKYFINIFDCRYIQNQKKTIVQSIRSEDFRMIDYATDSLITTHIYQLPNDIWVIALFVEHIIIDAFSIQLLEEELSTIYKSLTNGQTQSKYPVGIQLKDYTNWKNNLVRSQKNISYWETAERDTKYEYDIKKLYDQFEYNEEIGKVIGKKGKYTFCINRHLNNNLVHLCKDYGVSPFGLMIGLFVILLSRFFKQKNILVSILYSGREQGMFSRLLANCTEFVFLFNTIPPNSSIQSMIKKIYLNFLKSIKYAYPWEQSGRWPFDNKNLFKINYFTLQRSNIINMESKHEVLNSPGMTSVSYFEMSEMLNGMEFTCKYSLQHYTKNIMVTICKNYVKLLEEVVRNPTIRVSDFDLKI